MNKRERLERVLSGEKADRVPIALWRHWQGDDQRPADLAKAIFAFQKQWNFDFLTVAPANTYMVVDYGLKDSWQGNTFGTRTITQRLVKRSLDWTDLRRLDPNRGNLGQQIETLTLLHEQYGEEVPLILTIPSPLTQAEMLGGKEQVLRDLRTATERLKTGLNTLTDTTLRYLEVLRKTPLAGIWYEITWADYTLVTEAEYGDIGSFYDRKILNALPSQWWLNGVHIAGHDPMLQFMQDYPVQIFSWEDRATKISLAQGKTRFNGVVCGGLERDSLHLGMPGEIREQTIQAIEETYGVRFILSLGQPMMATTPRANIRTARQLVEEMPFR